MSQSRKSQSKPGILSKLFQPVDIASLAVFRISFGGIMLVAVWQAFSRGWIDRYYIAPAFHFTYYGFDWVHPWPGQGMVAHFFVLGFLATCILLGYRYRLAAILFCLGYVHLFLMEAGEYQNHYYLICLISFLMIFVSPHRCFSIDAWRRPQSRADTVPAWQLWLLRFQLGIAYFYGGIAKLNPDWLRCEPMRGWLRGSMDFPVIGRFFTNEFVVLFFVYGGLLFDLLIVPLLLWRRTRPYAFAAAVFFHLMNSRLFEIDIFPWFMLAGTLLFFAPDWPRTLLRRLGAPLQDATVARPAVPWRPRLTLVLLAAYGTLQVLIPLRHWLYPGNVSWTEEGHQFSWHMMLRNKEAQVKFFVRDPATRRSWEVDPSDYLTARQVWRMSTRPDMILQFAHYLAARFREQEHASAEVRAQVLCMLNRRKPQLLIDPKINLAAQSRSPRHASWIRPLTEPLPPFSAANDSRAAASDFPDYGD